MAPKMGKEVRTTPKAEPKRVKEPVLETAGDASASDQAAKKEDGQAPMEHDGSGAPPSQLLYARGTVSAICFLRRTTSLAGGLIGMVLD